MKRRQFVTATLAATGYTALAGCMGDEGEASQDGGFPSYDLPGYSDWIPASRQTNTDDESQGVFFTHLNWDDINALNDDETEGNATESEGGDDGQLEAVVDRVPVMGLPLYGSIITPAAMLGIMFYPFSEDIVPETESEAVEGVDTNELTWVDNTLVFHGNYDLSVFEDHYSDGFEVAEERDGFTVYVGAEGFVDGLAYAISEETLVVAMQPGDEETYDTETLVNNALDRNLNQVDRMVDESDGEWLFETTGDSPMIFGVWKTDDLVAALETEGESGNATSAGNETSQNASDSMAEPSDEIDSNPVYDNVESLVNTINFDVGAEGEMQNIEARFAGIYAEGETPSEDDVREHLIGEEDVPHEISIEETRIHATATFEDGVPENNTG